MQAAAPECLVPVTEPAYPPSGADLTSGDLTTVLERVAALLAEWGRLDKGAQPDSEAFDVAVSAVNLLSSNLRTERGLNILSGEPITELVSADTADLLGAAVASAAESAIRNKRRERFERHVWVTLAREWAELARLLAPTHPHTRFALALACLEEPFSSDTGRPIATPHRNFRAAERLLLGLRQDLGSTAAAGGDRLSEERAQRARHLAEKADRELSRVQQLYLDALFTICDTKSPTRVLPRPGEPLLTEDQVERLLDSPVAKVLRRIGEAKAAELVLVAADGDPAGLSTPPRSGSGGAGEAPLESPKVPRSGGGGGGGAARREAASPATAAVTPRRVREAFPPTHQSPAVSLSHDLWRILTLDGPEFLNGARIPGGVAAGATASRAGSATAPAGADFCCLFWNIQSSLPTHPLAAGLPAKISTLRQLTIEPSLPGLAIAALVECPGSGVAGVARQQLAALVASELPRWRFSEAPSGKEAVGFAWDADILMAVGAPEPFPDSCPPLDEDTKAAAADAAVLALGAGSFAFQRPPVLALFHAATFSAGAPCARPQAAAALEPLGLVGVLAVHLKSVAGNYTARTQAELRRLGREVVPWAQARMEEAAAAAATETAHASDWAGAAAAAAAGRTLLLGGDVNLDTSSSASTAAGRHTHAGDAWAAIFETGMRLLTPAGEPTNFGPPVGQTDHCYDAALLLHEGGGQAVALEAVAAAASGDPSACAAQADTLADTLKGLRLAEASAFQASGAAAQQVLSTIGGEAPSPAAPGASTTGADTGARPPRSASLPSCTSSSAITSAHGYAFPAMAAELADAQAVLAHIESRPGRALGLVDELAAELRKRLQARVKLEWGDHKPVAVRIVVRGAAAPLMAEQQEGGGAEE